MLLIFILFFLQIFGNCGGDTQYDGTVILPNSESKFRITVIGVVSDKNGRGSINIWDSDKRMDLHMNIRLGEGNGHQVVFNTLDGDKGWGLEEYHEFPTLKRKSVFKITIDRDILRYTIKVNSEPIYLYKCRTRSNLPERKFQVAGTLYVTQVQIYMD